MLLKGLARLNTGLHWFSFPNVKIKVVAIIFFIFVSVYVLCRDRPGFSAYEAAGGPFLDVSGGDAFKNTVEAMIGMFFILFRRLHGFWRN